MKQEHKLYAALAVVVALGVAVWLVRSERAEKAEARAPGGAQQQELPMAKLSEEQTKKLDKLVIQNKDQEPITLEKKGDEWEVTAPLAAKANQQAVETALGNLQKIEMAAKIGEGEDLHAKYELEEGEAVRVQAFEGGEPVFDWLFGKRGTRGGKGGSVMVRKGGEGAPATVYAATGFSSANWAKKVKDWRHNEILKVEEANVVGIEVENEHGKFSFTKDGDAWKPKHYPRSGGKLANKAEDIEGFDESKIKDLLRPFKTLKAQEFAEEGADTGVSEPLDAGGAIVRLTMKDDEAPSHIVKIGKKQEGENRYLAVEGDPVIYVVTSWAADYALGDVEKYQKPEDVEAGDEEGENGEEAPEGAAPKAPKGKAPKGKAPKAPAPKAPPKAPAPKAPAPKAPAPKAPAPATP